MCIHFQSQRTTNHILVFAAVKSTVWTEQQMCVIDDTVKLSSTNSDFAFATLYEAILVNRLEQDLLYTFASLPLQLICTPHPLGTYHRTISKLAAVYAHQRSNNQCRNAAARLVWHCHQRVHIAYGHWRCTPEGEHIYTIEEVYGRQSVADPMGWFGRFSGLGRICALSACECIATYLWDDQHWQLNKCCCLMCMLDDALQYIIFYVQVWIM